MHPNHPAAARHRHKRCSPRSVAVRVPTCKYIAHLPRTHPLPSIMLVVLRRLQNASAYLFPYLTHCLVRSRTHARFLPLSTRIPPIHATTTTTTASAPARCLCSSVHSVCEKEKKSRFEKSVILGPPQIGGPLVALRPLMRRWGDEITIDVCKRVLMLRTNLFAGGRRMDRGRCQRYRGERTRPSHLSTASLVHV